MNIQLHKIKSFLLITLLVFFLSACSFTNPTFTMKLSSKDLQDNMQKKFPIKQNIMFGSMSLKNPQVKLEKDSTRMKTGITFSYKPPFMKAQEGYLEFSGRISYKKNQKAFYIVDPQIEDMRYKSASLSAIMPKPIMDMIAKMINEVFKEFPIYEVKGNSLKQKLFQKTLKKAEIKDEKLQITFGIP